MKFVTSLFAFICMIVVAWADMFPPRPPPGGRPPGPPGGPAPWNFTSGLTPAGFPSTTTTTTTSSPMPPAHMAAPQMPPPRNFK
ncbi:protein ALTERED PHOSPHATE STARVATION RESPONSE 1-like [Belonocnema kinseyi]|uniref:protein ALTERED PHOSPHATE STARVATION RESPONSE 1-like n=1 Tax=Belonocnema kinseyi TaxID=2817044 RepID=UPI00143D42F8|nr:protein ALTERED PHOSPHATE STARVATION RESPONSE 1-like [Belonocnema kinseyi]